MRDRRSAGGVEALVRRLPPGELVGLVRDLDWSRTPLGSVDSWPRSLRSTFRTVLALQYPMVLFWGRELALLYNDAYRPILGNKHPRSLGQPASECWREIWHIVGPMLETAGTEGHAIRQDDLLLPIERRGFVEECYFSFSYGPMEDDSGRVSGVFCGVHETTREVVGRRRLETLRSLSAVRTASTVGAADAAIAVLRTHSEDVARAEIHRVDDDGREILLAVTGEPAESPHRGRALVFPLRRTSDGRPLGALHLEPSPRLPFDSEYESFLGLVAAHVTQALSSAVEIEEEKQRVTDLRESESRFRDLADAMPVVIWSAGPDGRMDYYNRLYDVLFSGLIAEREGDASWVPLLHPDDVERTLAQYRRSIATGEPYENQLRMRDRGSGTYRWYLVRGYPVRSERGEIVRWVGSATDIDDQKRAEEVLRDADRAKDEFLAILAHELRNPLAPIHNAVELLELRSPPGDGLRPVRALLGRQVRHLARLVDDLMDVSRITRGDIELRNETVDAAEVIRQAVEAADPRFRVKRQSFRVELDPEPVFLVADVTRLAQSIANVLNNAAKFSDERGRVSLTTRAAADSFEIRIRDDGIGIAAEDLSKIFEPFVQAGPRRTRDGMGVGLSLARKLVELHGGTLDVGSEGIGKGTEVVFRLPRASAPGDVAPPADRLDAKPSPSRRILVVEDNTDSARSLCQLLAVLGHEVRSVADGRSAVTEAVATVPEVILLDLDLPDMTGYEVVAALRAWPELRSVAIVALSGHGSDADRQRTKDFGFDGHLVKPLLLQDLETVLAARGREAPDVTPSRAT